MQVTFWGVRGSIPTPETGRLRWGGNTACLSLEHPGCTPLVLDCGTGARGLGGALVRGAHREVDVLFSHAHMDHLFGLPFFFPLYTPGFAVRLTLPGYSDAEAREKVARFLNGTYHPTRLRDLASTVSFHGVRPSAPFMRGGFSVTSCALNHPGGALGYRVSCDGATIVYVTDTAPFARPGEGVAVGEAPTPGEQRVLALLRDAHVVVYDTMFSESEYLERMTWGHSYPEYAAALCRAAGVAHLVLFHHSPDATDDAMDALQARWGAADGDLRVSVAREGATLSVGGAAHG